MLPLLLPAQFETSHGYTSRREARQLLSEAQNHRCCYCGCTVEEPPFPSQDRKYNPREASLEHIVPRSRGGPDTYENLVVACIECNMSRPPAMMAIAYYYARLQGKFLRPAKGRRLVPVDDASPQPQSGKNRIARDAKGGLIAVFVPKTTKRQRKNALLKLVGHDVPFGHKRLPKTPTRAVPIEGASLGSIWPKTALG